MYEKSACYYDAIYSWKHYDREIEDLVGRLARRGISGGRWLDVACGTGKHLSLLPPSFGAFGVELDPEMIAIAMSRLSGANVVQGDMRDFDLGQTFEVVSCLFSSIGYMTELEDLRRAIQSMARHLASGGVLLVEPWFQPQGFHENYVGGDFFASDDLKVARVARSWLEGPISCMEMHHLVGEPGSVEHFVEVHRLGLYTEGEMRDAFCQAGLEVEFDPDGIAGRGLYTGWLR